MNSLQLKERVRDGKNEGEKMELTRRLAARETGERTAVRGRGEPASSNISAL